MTIEELRKRIRNTKPSLMASLDEAIREEADALQPNNGYRSYPAALEVASDYYAEEISDWLKATKKDRVISASDVLYTRRTPMAKALATVLLDAEKLL